MTGREAKPGYPAYLPPSYQSLGPEQDQQLDIVLSRAPAGGAELGPMVEFWVKTPNVRCRTRVALVLEPDGNTINTQTDLNTVIVDSPGFLWVAEKERSRSGVVRSSPVRNVVGTGAAPLAIPTDTRLWGYVFELETNGQELYGRFSPGAIDVAAAVASKWRLCVRYESVERLTTEEWNQFLGRYGIRCAPEGGVVQV